MIDSFRHIDFSWLSYHILACNALAVSIARSNVMTPELELCHRESWSCGAWVIISCRAEHIPLCLFLHLSSQPFALPAQSDITVRGYCVTITIALQQTPTGTGGPMQALQPVHGRVSRTFLSLRNFQASPVSIIIEHLVAL